jgi:hypothetical protein
LQEGSGSVEDQPHAAEYPSDSGEDLSGHETEFTEDPLGLPEVPRRRWNRKRHYVAPPPVPTNLESRLIIIPEDLDEVTGGLMVSKKTMVNEKFRSVTSDLRHVLIVARL